MQAEHYITHTKPYFCYMATTLIRQSVLKTTLRRRPFATFPASISHNTGTSRNATQQAWLAPEAIPIFVIVGSVLAGAGWYLARSARGPDVIWSKSNPTPWNDVQQDENTKILSGHHKFEKSWRRGAHEPQSNHPWELSRKASGQR